MRIGRIYKVVATQGNEVYVGSTFNTTRDRYKQHKEDYGKWKKDKHHFTYICNLFEKHGVDKTKVVLIKEYLVCDKKHLRAYEQLWISKLNCVNKNNTIQIKKMNRKAYYAEHKQEVCDRNKVWREKNKEARQKDKVTCVCGSTVRRDCYLRHTRTKLHLNFVSNK